MKRTNIQNIAIITFIAILVLVGGYFLATKKSGSEAPVTTYTNKTHGVTFTYPETYKLKEQVVTGAGTGTVVVITEGGLSIPRGGEGPTAITVGMYPQGLVLGSSANPVETWTRENPSSNFSVSNGTLGTTTIGGNEAFLYTWDGLYQGTSLVTDHNGTIVMLSVTYDGETDLEKREVFSNLVRDIQFIEVDKATSTPGANDAPQEATLRGAYECLPLKSGGVATPCSPGLRADNGNHYALDLATVPTDLVATRKGVRVQVIGILVPIEQISTDMWQKYNIKGIMKVDAFEKI